MSEIPPNIIGSSLQAGFQQAEVSKVRDAQRSAESSAARRGVKAIDDAGSTIEATEDDVSVFAEGEGAGGQGREREEESGEDQLDPHDASQPGGGVTTDLDGKKHLDIQA